MPKFIRVNARNKTNGAFSVAILNADIFDSISSASDYTEKFPNGGVGAIIFTKNTSFLSADGASTYAVKETVDELCEMLK